MPTIDELLNASNEVATCTVNPDTREIIVPEKYKILGVFSDEKVTKILFTFPKVVGNNVDLTEYNLYINYQNAIGRHNAYLVDDVTVSGDNITFSWLLSRDVTLSSGVVKYSVCAKKLNGDSISNEWNTAIANGVVIQGLEATQAIIEENSDIIEAILSKAHTHANKSVLDKFAEADGKPTYDGKTLGGGSPNAVLYTAQALTDAQKKQARNNVDAASSDFVITGSLTEAGGITLDKTFAQIQEAVNAGKTALMRIDGGPTTITLPLAVKNSEISTEYDFSIGYFIDGKLNGFTVRVMESGPVLYTASTPTNNPDGTMPQVSMAAAPTADMQIATKKYVDDHVSADVYVDFWPTGTEEYNGNYNGYQVELATDQTFDAIFDSFNAGNKIVARLYENESKDGSPTFSVNASVTGTKEFGAIYFQFVTANFVTTNADTGAIAGFPFIGEAINMMKLGEAAIIYLIENRNVLPTPNADGTDNGKVPIINGTKWELKTLPTYANGNEVSY